MIINLLLDCLHYLFTAFTAVLPAWSINLPDTIQTLIGTALAYNTLFPMVEFMTCATAFLYLGGAATALKWSKQVIDYIADVIP